MHPKIHAKRLAAFSSQNQQVKYEFYGSLFPEPLVWFSVRLDYKQPVFPLRTRASAEIAWRVCIVSRLTRLAADHAGVMFLRGRRLSSSLACSFCLTIPDCREWLLLVYLSVDGARASDLRPSQNQAAHHRPIQSLNASCNHRWPKLTVWAWW